MTASTSGKDKSLQEGRGIGAGAGVGIVPGHAYSILGVYAPKLTLKNDIKLLKLRNPWYIFRFCFKRILDYNL